MKEGDLYKTLHVLHDIEVFEVAPLYDEEPNLEDSLHQALCDLICRKGDWIQQIRAFIWLRKNTSGCNW